MTGISNLGQALDQIARLKDIQTNFDSLSYQLTSGKKTQVFSGLGTDVLTSKRARADLGSIETYLNNITNADRRLNLQLTAIEEFKAQAENFQNALVAFVQQGIPQEGDIVYFDDPATPDVDEAIPIGRTSAQPDVDLELIQDLAANVFNFMGDLLNTQDGNRFILAGAQTTVQPYTDTGSLDSAITDLLSDWKNSTISTTELIGGLRSRDASADPNAVTDTLVGYSAELSSGNTKSTFVRISESSEIDTTALANDSAFRNVMVAAAYFKSETLVPVVDAYIPPNAGPPALPDVEGAPGADTDEMKQNFFEVFNALVADVNTAIDDIDRIRFRLESARAEIETVRKFHVAEKNLLEGTVSDIEDVDVNEVAVQLNTLQIQLDASYRVTARLQELSLVNFI